MLRLQRQHAAVVLQQHQRFAHGLSRDRAMLGRAQQFELAADLALRGLAGFEQAEPELDPQDPAHRIIQPLLADRAGFCCGQRGLVEPLPAVRRHRHVQARIDRGRAVVVLAAGNLAMAVPVADHETAERHPPLQCIGEVALVAVHPLAIDAVEARHHRLRTGRDRGRIAGGVDPHQRRVIDRGIALVLAAGGAAIAEEMLGRCDHVATVEELLRAHLALQAFDHRAGIARDHVRRFRIAFVGTAPTIVLRHRDGRAERPFHAGGARLDGGDIADLAHQFRVAHRAQADVVREQGGANDIALPMDRIDAVQDRDGLAALRGIHRRLVERVRLREPLRRRGVVLAAGIGIAAGQHRTKPVLAHVVRGDAGDIALHQLADLFFHRHRGEQCFDALFQRRVIGERPLHFGPCGRGGFRLCRGGLFPCSTACHQGQRDRSHESGVAERHRMHRTHPSICSSSLPLVSWMKRRTRK